MTTNEIIARFALPEGSVPAETKQLNSGIINQTFRVTMTDGRRYILQNINTNVFRDPDGLMNNIFGVTEHLRKKLADGAAPGVTTMKFIKTTDGGHYFRDEDDKCWRMYVFIDGESFDLPTRPGLFYEAAKAFGEFQRMLSDYPADTLSETIPDFHNTPKRFRDFLDAVEHCPLPERLSEAEAEVGRILSLKELASCAVDQLKTGGLPLRVTHNDTKLNNVLMNKTTGKGLCVIDLDTVMPGTLLYDFGDAIRVGANTAAEDEPDTSKISLSVPLYEEFLRGFTKGIGDSLTGGEKKMLPDSAALITLEQAMRFLGDYLSGDTYYKIKYEKHNLVRARAQLTLLDSIMARLPELRAL